MNIDEILKHFEQFLGLTAEEAQAWQSLCSTAMQGIQRELKTGADSEENSAALNMAAAAVAFYRYALIVGAGDEGDIRVGDVSVSVGKGPMGAPFLIKNEFMAAIEHCLKNESMVFKQVDYGC